MIAAARGGRVVSRDAEHGLPPLRRGLVLRRGDVEEVPMPAENAGDRRTAPTLQLRPLRARRGRVSRN